MFGSVSSDYPETKQMVLKRWTTLEAVQAMASSERNPEPAGKSTDRGFDPTPPFGIRDDGAEDFITEQAPTPPFGLGELDEIMSESTNGDADFVPTASKPLEEAAEIAEPEPGNRYFVTLAQRRAIFPSERCAHCLRRPAPRKLQVTLGPDSDLGYQVPLCQSCYERARARSEEQKSAKLVAHLSSILIASVLIVGALVSGLVNLADPGALDLLLIATLGLVGYGLPAVLLMGRSSRMPPSDDAKFVRSTLRLRGDGGLAFGWRNRGYAELFTAANRDLLLGELTRLPED